MERFKNHVMGIALLLIGATASILVTSNRGVAERTNTPVAIVAPLPLPVTEATAATQPFAISFNLSVAQDRGDYTVPAGKRLVIETITARGAVPPGEFVDFDLFVTTGGAANVRYVFQPRSIGVFGILERFETCQSVHLYADPGTLVQAVFQKNSGANAVGTATFSISGHLVDLQ